jgi:hypothetical protein
MTQMRDASAVFQSEQAVQGCGLSLRHIHDGVRIIPSETFISY